MAPKGGRGGGGRGGYGSVSSSCPDAFTDGYTVVYFAFFIVFFLMTLSTMFASGRIKKRSPQHSAARKLLGWVYATSLTCFLIYYALRIVSTVLDQCQVGDVDSVVGLAITYQIFSELAEFLLLVLVVWVVNTVLREPLGGHHRLFKITSTTVLAIVGCLTCAVIGVGCYNVWTITDDGRQYESLNLELIRLDLAYYILYMLASVAGSAISVWAVLALGRSSLAYSARKLRVWVIILGASMFFWLLLDLIIVGSTLKTLEGQYPTLDRKTYEALGFLIGFFQIFSFIAILCMTPAADFKPGVIDPTSQGAYPETTEPVHSQAPFVTSQQQYAANQPPTQQHYAYQTSQNPAQQYYNQLPVHNGPAPEVRS